eukprot:4366265-Prymnesium_polylepis.1
MGPRRSVTGLSRPPAVRWGRGAAPRVCRARQRCDGARGCRARQRCDGARGCRPRQRCDGGGGAAAAPSSISMRSSMNSSVGGWYVHTAPLSSATGSTKWGVPAP